MNLLLTDNTARRKQHEPLITDGKNAIPPVARINGWTNALCKVRSLKQRKNCFSFQCVYLRVYFFYILLLSYFGIAYHLLELFKVDYVCNEQPETIHNKVEGKVLFSLFNDAFQ
jgi:hypothetical protein